VTGFPLHLLRLAGLIMPRYLVTSASALWARKAGAVRTRRRKTTTRFMPLSPERLRGGADHITDPNAEKCRRVRAIDPDVRKFTRLFLAMRKNHRPVCIGASRVFVPGFLALPLDKDANGRADQFCVLFQGYGMLEFRNFPDASSLLLSGTLSSISQAFVPSRGEYLNVNAPSSAILL